MGEAEGVDGEDGHFLRFIGESKFGNEVLWGGRELILLYFLLGEAAPKANVDHDIPGDELL